jgi:DNA topoisomerase-2
MQVEKLTNQVRFIQMIIKKELNVSGRKKKDILQDLTAKGFKTFAKVAKVAAAGDAEPEENGAEDEDKADNTEASGFDYLLHVSHYFRPHLIIRCKFTVLLQRKWRD